MGILPKRKRAEKVQAEIDAPESAQALAKVRSVKIIRNERVPIYSTLQFLRPRQGAVYLNRVKNYYIKVFYALPETLIRRFVFRSVAVASVVSFSIIVVCPCSVFNVCIFP